MFLTIIGYFDIKKSMAIAPASELGIPTPPEAVRDTRFKSVLKKTLDTVTHPIKGPLIATAVTIATIAGAQSGGFIEENRPTPPTPSTPGLVEPDGFHTQENFAAAGASLEQVQAELDAGNFKQVQVGVPEGTKTILVTKNPQGFVPQK